MFSGKTKPEVAEELAEYFNKISKEFNGLDESQIPETHSSPLPSLDRAQVENLLKVFRIPKSMVPGDIFPQLVNSSAHLLAVPLADIYNTISRTGVRPKSWKTEYVTPIPKGRFPTSMNDLRNISCTKLFSKVYESFILPHLTGQASLRKNQYGGVRGLGTEHFLVNFWQKVLED